MIIKLKVEKFSVSEAFEKKMKRVEEIAQQLQPLSAL